MKYIPPALALILTSTTVLHGDVIPIGPGSAYTQNFDSLLGTGSSSTVPAGWKYLETGSGADGLYNANTGSSTGGNTYSFGAAGSTDRAFGTLLSGTLVSRLGVTFENSSGGLINSFAISYSGEQWRSGETDRPDRLEFSYVKNTEALDAGSFLAVGSLNFNSVNNSSVGALDGNANNSLISGTITGFTLLPGETITFRWSDFNANSADDGLAIDNLSVTAAIPEPQSWALIVAGFGVLAVRRRHAS